MTGVAQGPTRLISQGTAERLFEALLYDRVCELVDLDQMFELQCFLTAELMNVGVKGEESVAIGRALIDRALAQLATDDRRYLRARSAFRGCDCERVERELEAERR